MNQNDITLRPARKEDYPQLENLIRKTWNYDTLSGNPKDARHMSRLYLRSCLTRATYSCVAEADGRVLGVILAHSENDPVRGRIRRILSQLMSVLLLYSTKTGRQIGRFFGRFDSVDTELLNSSHRTFGGEICLFAIEKEARGAGLGKELFAAALDYLKSRGADSFYLFTDTSCTYQFYEKRGMVRLAEQAVDLAPQVNYKLNMFLYGYEFA